MEIRSVQPFRNAGSALAARLSGPGPPRRGCLRCPGRSAPGPGATPPPAEATGHRAGGSTGSGESPRPLNRLGDGRLKARLLDVGSLAAQDRGHVHAVELLCSGLLRRIHPRSIQSATIRTVCSSSPTLRETPATRSSSVVSSGRRLLGAALASRTQAVSASFAPLRCRVWCRLWCRAWCRIRRRTRPPPLLASLSSLPSLTHVRHGRLCFPMPLDTPRIPVRLRGRRSACVRRSGR